MTTTYQLGCTWVCVKMRFPPFQWIIISPIRTAMNWVFNAPIPGRTDFYCSLITVNHIKSLPFWVDKSQSGLLTSVFCVFFMVKSHIPKHPPPITTTSIFPPCSLLRVYIRVTIAYGQEPRGITWLNKGAKYGKINHFPSIGGPETMDFFFKDPYNSKPCRNRRPQKSGTPTGASLIALVTWWSFKKKYENQLAGFHQSCVNDYMIQGRSGFTPSPNFKHPHCTVSNIRFYSQAMWPHLGFLR